MMSRILSDLILLSSLMPYIPAQHCITSNMLTKLLNSFLRSLSLKGIFFLSDENGASPAQQLIVQKRIGWTSARTLERTDPETGETYIYGNENIRPPFRWAQLMRAVRLEPIYIKYCRFMPPLKWSIERLVKTERSLRTKPFLAELGAIGFLMVSQRLGEMS